MSQRGSLAGQPGRPPTTTRNEIARAGLELILAKGYAHVTIDDIAAAAGIARRTFFGYFDSKSDVPWGDFDGLIERMRAGLNELPQDIDPVEGLRSVIIEVNSFNQDRVEQHRQRMELLFDVPEVLARSTMRYAAWREVVATYLASRWGVNSWSLEPAAVAAAYLGVATAAYECWLRDDSVPIQHLLDQAMQTVQINTGLNS